MKTLLPLLSLSLLCGCASTQTLAVPVCPKPAPLTPEMRVPAPPPGAFQACMREVIAYGEGAGPISPACSTLLQPVPTR